MQVNQRCLESLHMENWTMEEVSLVNDCSDTNMKQNLEELPLWEMIYWGLILLETL